MSTALIETALVPRREQLDAVVQTVFETMLFLEPEPAADDAAVSLLCAEVSFHGAASGWLRFGVTEEDAVEIAGNFLGQSDSPESVEQVLCETANMLCGALLTAWFPDSLFSLDSPLMLEGERPARADAHLSARYQLSNGPLEVAFQIEPVTTTAR